MDIYNRAYGLGKYSELGPDSTLNDLFTNEAVWSRYLGKDPYGNDRLRTFDDLMSEMYDKDQNITIRGVEFYDQMLNALGAQYGDDYSFSKWLANNNEDLYRWSKANNMYAWGTVDEYGANSNLGYVRNMLGLDSTDAKYDFAERYGAFSKQEIKNLYKPIEDKIQNLISLRESAEGDEWDTEEVVEQYKGIVDELQKVVEQFGMYDYVEKLGGWDKLKSDLEGMLEGTFKGTSYYSATYEAAKEIIDVPVVGDVLAFFGAIANSVTFDAANAADAAKQSNIYRMHAIENAYANLVDSMVTESYKRQQAAQTKFNNRYN
jgi:hypothetical protein